MNKVGMCFFVNSKYEQIIFWILLVVRCGSLTWVSFRPAIGICTIITAVVNTMLTILLNFSKIVNFVNVTPNTSPGKINTTANHQIWSQYYLFPRSLSKSKRCLVEGLFATPDWLPDEPLVAGRRMDGLFLGRSSAKHPAPALASSSSSSSSSLFSSLSRGQCSSSIGGSSTSSSSFFLALTFALDFAVVFCFALAFLSESESETRGGTPLDWEPVPSPPPVPKLVKEFMGGRMKNTSKKPDCIMDNSLLSLSWLYPVFLYWLLVCRICTKSLT